MRNNILTIFAFLAIVSIAHGQLWFWVDGILGNDTTGQPGVELLPYRTIQGAINAASFIPGLPLISIHAVQAQQEDNFVFPPFDIKGLNVYIQGFGDAFVAPFIDSAPNNGNGLTLEGVTVLLQGPVKQGLGNITCTKCNWQSFSTPFVLDDLWFTIDKNTFLWFGLFDTFFKISGASSAVELIQSPITLYAGMAPIAGTITFFEVSNQANLLTERTTVGTEFAYTANTKYIIAKSLNARQSRHYDFTLAFNEGGRNIQQVTWASGINSVIEFYGAKGLGSGNATVQVLNDMTGNSKVLTYDFYVDNYIQIKRDNTLGYYDITDLSGKKTSAGLEVNARFLSVCGGSSSNRVNLNDQFLVIDACNTNRRDNNPSLVLPDFSSTSRGKRIDIKNVSGRRIKLVGNVYCEDSEYLSSPSAVLYFVDGVWYRM